MLNTNYFETVANDSFSFNAQQLATLPAIANQCPLAGGEAVYRSRSLLSIVEDNSYNDKEICLTAGIAYKKEKEEELQSIDKNLPFQLAAYPNPANDYLLLQSNLTSDELFSLEVLDHWGRIVANERFNLLGKRFRLATDNFQNGIYLLKVYKNNEPVYYNKVSIMH